MKKKCKGKTIKKKARFYAVEVIDDQIGRINKTYYIVDTSIQSAKKAALGVSWWTVISCKEISVTQVIVMLFEHLNKR